MNKDEIELELEQIKRTRRRLDQLQHEAINHKETAIDFGYGYVSFISFINDIEILLDNWKEELENNLDTGDNNDN